MVFCHRSSSEPESNLEPSMASTLSAKSQQPLHNFPLPELKWGINNPSSSNHHFRSRNKLAESTHKSDDELDYPLRDLSPDDRSPMMQSAASDCSIERSLSVEKQKSAANEEKVKILLRIRTKGKSPDEAGEEEAGGGQIKVVSAASAAASGGEAEEPPPKMWNLRPRKPASKPFSDGSSLRIGEAPPQEVKTQMPGRPEFSRSRAVAAEAKTAEKKQKFSISLSKEEIEEDIFMLTGSKPARRPKKRPRIIQKQLDNLFPGLWLPFINPDSYRVPDTPAKG